MRGGASPAYSAVPKSRELSAPFERRGVKKAGVKMSWCRNVGCQNVGESHRDQLDEYIVRYKPAKPATGGSLRGTNIHCAL